MDAKLSRYFNRTIEHIHRVQKNMLLLVTKYADQLELSEEQCRQAIENVLRHDASKFSVVQFRPYVELTEFYHQRRILKNEAYQYPPGTQAEVDKAVQHHYENENHHPERFGNGIGKYDKLEAIETACDLQAMAQEFNEGTCRKYFEEVWKPKQSKHFYDDFNWAEVTHWMNLAIKCFEMDSKTMEFSQ
jgi:hypothetical protein